MGGGAVEVGGYGVEWLGEFGKLRPALELDALGDICAGNRGAGFGKELEWQGEAGRRPDADQNAGSDSEQSEPQLRVLYLRDVTVGILLGLLRHHGPAQARGWNVRPQHRHLSVFSFGKRIFFRNRDTRVAALLFEVFYQLVGTHILAGEVLGICRSHQASTVVNHESVQSLTAGVLEPAYEELKVHDQSQRAEIYALIWSAEHRLADAQSRFYGL